VEATQSSTNEWMGKQNSEYVQNGLLPHKIGQTQKDKHWMIPSYEVPRIGKSLETESRQGFPGAGG
jgi:hypothetical protein